MTEPALAQGGEALLDGMNAAGQLRWRKTWISIEDRFSGLSPVLRTEAVHVSPAASGYGLWRWSLTADHDEVSHNIGATHGVEPSAVEAALRGEAAWFAAIKGTSLERRTELRNAYAQARDPG